MGINKTVIKGEGFNPHGGGFTALSINGLNYDTNYVAEAVAAYELPNLKDVSPDQINRVHGYYWYRNHTNEWIVSLSTNVDGKMVNEYHVLPGGVKVEDLLKLNNLSPVITNDASYDEDYKNWRELALEQHNEIKRLNKVIESISSTIEESTDEFNAGEILNSYEVLKSRYDENSPPFVEFKDVVEAGVPQFKIEEYLVNHPDALTNNDIPSEINVVDEITKAFQEVAAEENHNHETNGESDNNENVDSMEAELLSQLDAVSNANTSSIAAGSNGLVNPLFLDIDQIAAALEEYKLTTTDKTPENDGNKVVSIQEILQQRVNDNKPPVNKDREEYDAVVEKEAQDYIAKYGFLSKNFKPKKSFEEWKQNHI